MVRPCFQFPPRASVRYARGPDGDGSLPFGAPSAAPRSRHSVSHPWHPPVSVGVTLPARAPSRAPAIPAPTPTVSRVPCGRKAGVLEHGTAPHRSVRGPPIHASLRRSGRRSHIAQRRGARTGAPGYLSRSCRPHGAARRGASGAYGGAACLRIQPGVCPSPEGNASRSVRSWRVVMPTGCVARRVQLLSACMVDVTTLPGRSISGRHVNGPSYRMRVEWTHWTCSGTDCIVSSSGPCQRRRLAYQSRSATSVRVGGVEQQAAG